MSSQTFDIFEDLVGGAIGQTLRKLRQLSKIVLDTIIFVEQQHVAEDLELCSFAGGEVVRVSLNLQEEAQALIYRIPAVCT